MSAKTLAPSRLVSSWSRVLVPESCAKKILFTVEVHAIAASTDLVGVANDQNSFLVNSSNEALAGAALPSFPRGGFPSKSGGVLPSNRLAKNWQAISNSGMLYPSQVLDGSFGVSFPWLKHSLEEKRNNILKQIGAQAPKASENNNRSSAPSFSTLLSRFVFPGGPLPQVKTASIANSESNEHSTSGKIINTCDPEFVFCPAGSFVVIRNPHLAANTGGLTNPAFILNAVAPFAANTGEEWKLSAVYERLLRDALFSDVLQGSVRTRAELGRLRQYLSLDECAKLDAVAVVNRDTLGHPGSASGESPHPHCKSMISALLGTGARGWELADGARRAAIGVNNFLSEGFEFSDSLAEKSFYSKTLQIAIRAVGEGESPADMVSSIFNEEFQRTRKLERNSATL